jgi:hypothetical protein
MSASSKARWNRRKEGDIYSFVVFLSFQCLLHHSPQFTRQRGQVCWRAKHDLLQDFAQFLQFRGDILQRARHDFGGVVVK